MTDELPILLPVRYTRSAVLLGPEGDILGLKKIKCCCWSVAPFATACSIDKNKVRCEKY